MPQQGSFTLPIPQKHRTFVRSCLIVVLLLLGKVICFSQTTSSDSLYNINNRIKYCGFLEKNKEYEILKNEYRILYDSTGNSAFIKNRIRILLLEKNWDTAAIIALQQKVWDSVNWNEICLLRSVKNEKKEINRYKQLKTKNDDYYDSMMLICCSILLNSGPREAQSVAKKLSDEIPSGYLSVEGISLLQNLSVYRHRKPWKAVLLSVIIPGSGKFYTHRNADGFATLGIVAANTLVSILSYKKLGSKSFWPYAFGSLALGFYAGGIYGSADAAKKENKYIADKIKQNAKDYLLHYYSI